MIARCVLSALVSCLAGHLLSAHPISQSYWLLEVSDDSLVSHLIIPLEEAVAASGLEEEGRADPEARDDALRQLLEEHFLFALDSGEKRLEWLGEVRFSGDQVVVEGTIPLPLRLRALQLGSTLPQATRHPHQVFCRIAGLDDPVEFLLTREEPLRRVDLKRGKTSRMGGNLVGGLLAFFSSPVALLLGLVLFAGPASGKPLGPLAASIASFAITSLACAYRAPPLNFGIFPPLLIGWMAWEALIETRRGWITWLASALSGAALGAELAPEGLEDAGLMLFILGGALGLVLVALVADRAGALLPARGAVRKILFGLLMLLGLALFGVRLLS